MFVQEFWILDSNIFPWFLTLFLLLLKKEKIFCNQEAESYKTWMYFLPNQFLKQIEIVGDKLGPRNNTFDPSKCW